MPGAGLSAKGVMLAPPQVMRQQGSLQASCPQQEFTMRQSHPLADIPCDEGSLYSPGEDRREDTSWGRGPRQLLCAPASVGADPGSALLGCSQPLLSPGGQHGGNGGSRLEPHGNTFATN